MRKATWVTLACAGVVAVLVAIPALCQQGGPLGGDEQMLALAGATPVGMDGPLPMLRPPAATVTAVDGVVYVACEGKLTAFEAKTLRKLAEAAYWDPGRRAQ